MKRVVAGGLVLMATLSSSCVTNRVGAETAPEVAVTSDVTWNGAPAGVTGARATSLRVKRARARIEKLTAYLGHRGVSVAVAGRRGRIAFRFGAHGGMRTASIAKLYILETLLLQHQRSGHPIDADDRDLATRMIEHSDNDAADDLYEEIGLGPALRRAAGPLGLHNTVPGPGYIWGYTKTCATDYVALLADLTTPRVLHRRFRRFALHLLANVESDQRWGVSAAADPDTRVWLKNGWLAAIPDDDRWIVNSVGIVTVDRRRVLMAVLTQHGTDFDRGVDLVQTVARITARAIARP